MKTANELAQEYFAKTPMERAHTTLQDYVFDYQQEKIHKALLALCESDKTKEYRIDKAMEILK